MAEKTLRDELLKPWDPVGEFAGCINQSVPTEKQVNEVLAALRLDLIEAIAWTDRAKILAIQTALFAVVLEARKLRRTKYRVYGITAAEAMLDIMADMVFRMRPPEQDKWVRKSVTGRKIILLLSATHAMDIDEIAQRTRRSVKWVGKLASRLQETGLVGSVFAQRRAYYKLESPGVELQESIWLEEKRAREKRRRRSS